MKLFQRRAPKALLLSGLALLAGGFATAGTASAQRRVAGPDRHVEAAHTAPAASAALSFGQQGVTVQASFGQRARIPRGYDGGHYETRYHNVWVPGYTHQVWEPAIYEWRYDPCGNRVQVCVRAGYYRTVCVPGRYESRATQVWVPARGIQIGWNRGGFDRGRQPVRQAPVRQAPVRQHRVTHVGRGR